MPACDSQGLSPEELRDRMALRDLEVGQTGGRTRRLSDDGDALAARPHRAPARGARCGLAAEADAFAAAPTPVAGAEFAALMDEAGWSVSLAAVLGAPRRTVQRWQRPEADVAEFAQLAVRTATETAPRTERAGPPSVSV